MKILFQDGMEMLTRLLTWERNSCWKEFELVMNTMQLFYWKHWLGEYFSKDRNQTGWNNFSEIPPPPSSDFNLGFPGGFSGKESVHQCGRLMFDPWVRKIPWIRKWQPTHVFLPGKSNGQRSLVDYSPGGRKRVKYNVETENKSCTQPNGRHLIFLIIKSLKVFTTEPLLTAQRGETCWIRSWDSSYYCHNCDLKKPLLPLWTCFLPCKLKPLHI